MKKTLKQRLQERDLEAIGEVFYMLGSNTPNALRKYYKFHRMNGKILPSETEMEETINEVCKALNL